MAISWSPSANTEQNACTADRPVAYLPPIRRALPPRGGIMAYWRLCPAFTRTCQSASYEMLPPDDSL